MSEFERIVNISPAFDKRTDNPKTNYRIGSCSIWFILKKDNKAVQFMFGTDWFLPETVKEYREQGVKGDKTSVKLRGEKDRGVDGWDIGYHSPTPEFEGQSSMDCKFIEGGKCYYDGSGLRARENQEILIRKGSEGVWKFLKEEWEARFGSEKE